MSERPPSEPPPEGWDTQAVEEAPPPTPDEVLTGQLRRRGVRPAPRTLAASIARLVADTPPEPRWRLTLAIWRPRLAVAVSGLTVVLLAGLLFVGVTLPRTGGLPTPSPSTSPTPSATAATGIAWDPTVRALTPPQLLAVLATGPAPGTVLIVDDQIVPFLVSCAGNEHCPSGELRNDQGVYVEAPPGGYLPWKIDPSLFTTSIMGPLAVQVGTGPNLVFLGAVANNGLRMAFTARDLAQRSAMGGLFVIRAWIHRTGPIPCPSIAGTQAPQPTSELGLPAPRLDFCGGIAYLSDADPGSPPYVADPDPTSFTVQSDAYQRFSSFPSSDGAARNGIFLVRDWAGYGEILARLEPVPIPSDEATAPSIEPFVQPTVGPSPSTAGGTVISVDELLRRVQDRSLKAGSIAIASIPVQAVSERWAPGAVHSCPQLCPMWHLFSGTRSVDIVVSMAAPAPRSILGVQAFLILDDGGVRALGPAATGPTGEPLDGIAGAAVASVADRLTVVRGWLRTGPPLLCPMQPAPLETGLLGESLSWSQCPGVWILPSPADPWSGPVASPGASGDSGSGGIGDLSVPDGTLHVQDRVAGATLDPREGTWLVRAARTNACPPWARCPTDSNPVAPQPGITWYELVGPVAAPAPTTPATPAPSATTSPLVLNESQLVAGMSGGAFPTGRVLIADATIAPVLLPSFPPSQGTVAGKIRSLRVHWASDPDLSARNPIRTALRVRADGDLDYLGPVVLDGDLPFAGGSDSWDTRSLYVVHGWLYQGPPPSCPTRPAPASPQRLVTGLDGRELHFDCADSFILPSGVVPQLAATGDYYDLPIGTMVVQRGASMGQPERSTLVEGAFVVRPVPCTVTPAFDACDVREVPTLSSMGELVGVVTTGPLSAPSGNP